LLSRLCPHATVDTVPPLDVLVVVVDVDVV
jgi:hypothetical protein